MHASSRPCFKSFPVRGFTLVEMMVVVAILGILSAIALPAYRDYVIQGKIPDATGTLAAKQTKIEQYFQDNLTYVGAPDCSTDTTSSPKYFNFSCTSSSPTAYVLQAAGKSTMAGFTYTVAQDNSKTTSIVSPAPSTWVTSGNCWITKRGGTC